MEQIRLFHWFWKRWNNVTSDIETLIALRLTIYKLLDDINEEIERKYTYEDDNFKIKMNIEIEINEDNVLEDLYIYF